MECGVNTREKRPGNLMDNYKALLFFPPWKSTDLGFTEAMKSKGEFKRGQQCHWAVQGNTTSR